MRSYFSISTTASLMATTVERVQEEISKGTVHAAKENGEVSLAVEDLAKLGAALYLRDTSGLSRDDIDRILDRFILPWGPPQP